MPGSDDVPPGSTPPTTSTVATSIDATVVATGPISQADFMAFQQLLMQQFAAINVMPLTPPVLLLSPMACWTMVAYPPSHHHRTIHYHHYHSLPICHNTPFIVDLHLGATDVNHARIHPPYCLPTLPIPDPIVHCPIPVPPQQHCDGVFYGGVDGIRASTM
jgi:hypothetical protein